MSLSPAENVAEKLRQVRLAETALARAIYTLKLAERDAYKEMFGLSLNVGEVPAGSLEELHRAHGDRK